MARRGVCRNEMKYASANGIRMNRRKVTAQPRATVARMIMPD
jgi:hypothetical protein